jgi:hypothetical protein
MQQSTVECLRCGQARALDPGTSRHNVGACPRCEYVGWAYSDQLTERMRGLFRSLPVERRLLIRSL